MTMTNLKCFRRKNVSLKEAKNNDDGALSLTIGNMKKIIELNLSNNKIGDDAIIFFQNVF